MFCPMYILKMCNQFTFAYENLITLKWFLSVNDNLSDFLLQEICQRYPIEMLFLYYFF